MMKERKVSDVNILDELLKNIRMELSLMLNLGLVKTLNATERKTLVQYIEEYNSRGQFYDTLGMPSGKIALVLREYGFVDSKTRISEYKENRRSIT